MDYEQESVHKQNDLMSTFSILERHFIGGTQGQNTMELTLNSPYTVIDRMPVHQTTGITEDKMGSQIQHMYESIHTDWVLNGLG